MGQAVKRVFRRTVEKLRLSQYGKPRRIGDRVAAAAFHRIDNDRVTDGERLDAHSTVADPYRGKKTRIPQQSDFGRIRRPAGSRCGPV
ncbi:MAG: hypothetical protein Fues2KO_10970 [Fuerstiella sp.]